ncbi:Adenylate kinase 2 [Marasmius tenuissimus]|uniref:Adenylate kinase 2 n=1 Tax=Marasmius tenuissimus TaxID=585030 RepID=A0ABR3AEB1_9AGAR|nr:Adenylate kinase 2 [Marasmius tenuissimus]
MQSLRTIRPTAPVQFRVPRQSTEPITRPGRVLPHTRASVDSIRSISSTSSASKVTHSLNTLRSTAQEIRYHNDARPGRQLRMVMFGKPGAGKGTLSTRLVKKYDITTLSTGDLLRMHIQERTEVGRQAEEIVAQGGLVPDELMLQILTSKLDQLHNKHWILDGFPRTLPQGELLDTHLKKQGIPLSLVVNVEVPDEVILSRISDRWVHLPSGRVYNMSYNRPKIDGHDDETGEPLVKRPDDNPEIFARRLQKFYSTTSPLIAYYENQAKQRASPLPHRNPHQHPHQLAFHVQPPHRLMLQTVTGTTSDEIWPKLEATVTAAFPNIKERAESINAKRRHSLSDAVMAGSLNNLLQQ